MKDFDILQALDPHVVIECLNPESLLYVPSIEDEVEEAMEASNKVKTQKWYPVYIFVCHTGTLLSSLIQLWTKDQYSHSLISFDASMTQMYSFGRKKLNDDIPITGASNGFAVDDINNDFYTKWKKNIKYATFVIFVTKKQRAAMIKKVKFFIENQVKFTYDMAGLFAYAAHLPHEKQWSYFCSGFVADVLQTGEVLGKKRSYSSYSPQDLAELPMAYKVNEGDDFSEYRESKTKAKVKSAWNKFLKESHIESDTNTLVLV